MGINNLPQPQAGRRATWKTAAVVIAVFVSALWVIEIVNASSGGDLTD